MRYVSHFVDSQVGSWPVQKHIACHELREGTLTFPIPIPYSCVTYSILYVT
jgi:hypothetical protein